MWQLVSIVYTIASTTLIGCLMIAALVVGYDEIIHIIVVCVGGAILALPISYVVAKHMYALGRESSGN